MAQATHDRVEVLIGGAGFVGLALAIALRQALGPGFTVAVVDPALGRPGADARASAIVAGARLLFEAIGVWDRVAAAAQPINAMVISDSRLDDMVRPTFLTFADDIAAAQADAPAPFAHMVENAPLLAALTARAEALGVRLVVGAVEDFIRAADRVEARLADGRVLAARLLVAADGAGSRLRECAGIATRGWRYQQAGIVTTVAHQREHHGRAEERFLPAGPFAILPLAGRRSSIVWTEDAAEAARIVALPDAEFHDQLERRFGLQLGDISALGPRRAYPLECLVARAFVAERFALIGDAAHVIHPIAGQGLNLGLKDVAALAESVVDAARLGLDPGSATALDRYQRWRRFDTMAMAAATDGLNRLFSNRSDVLRLIRDVGLGLVDRVPALKQIFVREAAGLTGEVPRLLRGEAL
jgi:2-octaprenyl-6-methoxyphenol hydroxylase